MPSPAMGEIWELRVACYTLTQASANTFHYKVTALTGTVTDTYAANMIDNAIAAAWKAVMSSDASYRGCSLQRRFPLPRTRPAIDVSNDGLGTSLGESLPGQVSGIIGWTTDFAGPQYRGRTYVPFPSELFNESPALPTDAYVTLLDSLGEIMDGPFIIVDGANTLTLTRVLFNRASGASVVVTGKVSRKKWATQMRRGSYGKQNARPF